MNRIQLRCGKTIVPLCILAVSGSNYPKSDVKPLPSKDFFDTQGFPSKISWESKAPCQLYLSGVGMRRKNLYVTSVDVYRVGLYLSPLSLNDSKEWKKEGKSISIADTLVSTSNNSKITDQAKAGVILKFVRDVGKDSISEAFISAFVGCNEMSIKKFKEALSNTIVDGTIKKGEELGFFWLQNNGLVITKNNIVGKEIYEPELENRLLKVYLDPKLTVSSELISSFEANIDVITV